MNSLRTDDILGAKPRVRHMPLNLIRQRKIPTAFLTNMHPTNPEWSQPMNNPSNSNSESFSPIQYQNNDSNAYPFYSSNRLSKESKHVNYDFTRKQTNESRERYQNPITRQPEMTRNSSENKYAGQDKTNVIAEKRQFQHNVPPTRKQYAKGDELNRSLNLQRQAIDSPNPAQGFKRSEAPSRKSMDSRDQGYGSGDGGKNIFRGLGFNIISNHKYQYLLEYKQPKGVV